MKNRRASNPAAPGATSLVLLPLGPDTIQRFPPRRTHPAVGLKDTAGNNRCQLCFQTAQNNPAKDNNPIQAHNFAILNARD